MKVTELKGIGTSAAMKLKECGISTVEQLATSSIQDLVKVKGIGSKSAEGWIQSAKDIFQHTKIEEKEELLPIDAFLLRRFSSLGKKLIKVPPKKFIKMSEKNLKKYQDQLYTERIKFDPSIRDERNAMRVIDEKTRLIEDIIKEKKESMVASFIKTYIANPLRQGQFDDIINGDLILEEKATRIYNSINSKIRKKYPYSAADFHSRIEDVIRSL